MKKKFKLQDLDCANCAAKMEESIKKIDGVNDAVVSFMTQKMMPMMSVLMKLWMRLSVFVQKLSRIARFFCRR